MTQGQNRDLNGQNGYEGEKYSLSFVLKPFYFVLLIWVIFWLDQRFMLNLYHLGIMPHHIEGLIGVFTAPVLHGNLTHISNNTLPILALGSGLYYFYPRIAGQVILISWLTSGLMVWIIGRESYHIGASGLIYALAGFIFLSGLLRKQPNLLSLSLLVVFLYGGMVWGVFPVKENISYEAHLAGAVSGFLLAVYFRKYSPRVPVKKPYWPEEDDDESDEEDAYWIIADRDGKHQNEAWENYSGSRHGIHYIFNSRNDQDQKKKTEQ